MKNKLLLNNKTTNHIKFLPLNIEEIPKSKNEQILWCQERFNELEEKANSIFIKTNKKIGYSISVWEMNDLYYTIQSIRSDLKTYNNVVYVNKIKEDSIGIANFLIMNVETIMNDNKTQSIESKEDCIK